MLRLRILVLALPSMVAAGFAGGAWPAGTRPCVAISDSSVQIAAVPWRADLHVAFTDDPAAATVRVQIADSPEAADFAVVDDIDSPDSGACAANAATRLVAISEAGSGGVPVIYLSHQGPADYRIFVRSNSFSLRDAAALIVGANAGHAALAATL
jgi:hypothetical protein